MGQRRRSPPGAHGARQHICWKKTTPVAVKIKLKRLGKIRAPYYRIVVADARTKRDGRAIEEIGKYHPKAEPSFIEVDSERAQHWLSVGAQPTDPVRKLLEITGDWQKFKGLPGTEGTLKTAAPKEDRKEIFAAAVKETLGDAAPKGRAGREERARSGAAKDGESAAKGGRAAAKDSAQGKADKPARGKSAEAAGEAKTRSSGEAEAAGEAKSRDSGEAAGETKGRTRPAKGAQPKRGDSGQTAGEAESGKTADTSSDADAVAAQTADSESASGD
jgi:small subunit ribosomal protein S16